MSTTTADPGGRGIPGHWQQVSLRSLLRPRSERNRIDLPLLSVLRSAGVIPRNRNKAENHNFIPDDLSSYKAVRQGDFVINKMKAWSGSVGVAPMDGIVSPAYFVYEFLADVDVRYMNQLLRGPEMRDAFARVSRGIRVGQWDLNPQDIKDILVSLPPLEEQRLIVRYLDNAELRIAQAITAKQKMLQLIVERQVVSAESALLGHVGNAILIESGVPWIGKVPQHWEVVPLRSLVQFRKRTVGVRHKDFQLLSLTLRGVIVRDLSQMKGKFPSSFETYQEVRPSDFVFCNFDVEETPRAVGLAQDVGMITGAYDVFECRQPEAREYLHQFLLTADQGKKFAPLYRGMRKTIARSDLLAASVPLPPPRERELLVNAVIESRSQTDRALEGIRAEIDLLREYRTKLISDVVTGKLDVREEAAKMSDVDPVELAAVLAGGSMKSNTEEDDDNADN